MTDFGFMREKTCKINNLKNSDFERKINKRTTFIGKFICCGIKLSGFEEKNM